VVLPHNGDLRVDERGVDVDLFGAVEDRRREVHASFNRRPQLARSSSSSVLSNLR